MNNSGKTVKIHYRGTLDDGTVFDSSYERDEPLEFTCMAGDVIQGFDDAVVDMAVGDKKSIHLEPDQAYGEINPDLIQEVDLDLVSNADELPVGETVYMRSDDGQPFPVQVVKIEDGKVTFDLNHPLAGKPLNFDLELVDVQD